MCRIVLLVGMSGPRAAVAPDTESSYLAAGVLNWGGELEGEVLGGVVSAITTSAGTWHACNCQCSACEERVGPVSVLAKICACQQCSDGRG